MNTLAFEVRQALRALGRMSGTTALSVVTLGFGIAAAATTFSAVYAALVRAVPFPDADRIVVLHETRESARYGLIEVRWSFAAAQMVRRGARSFETIGTYSRASVAGSGGGDAEQVDGEIVTSGYFESLGVAPIVGQPFTAADDDAAREVVVLGDRIWRRRFAGDPAILGRPVDINGVRLTVAAVMPPGFEGVSGRAELWLPARMAPRLTYREYLTTPQSFINLVARLRPGVTLAQANAELAAIGPQLPVDVDPDAPPVRRSASAEPLDDARVDSDERRSLILVLAGGAAVLLVTCVNVAMLLLTRARGRRGEMAIRLALGASRGRLVRQLLIESTLIASGGGALGLLAASWGIAWLRRASPLALASSGNDYAQIAQFASPSMDAAVLLFTVLVALGSSILFGAAPALTASRSDPAQALAVAARSITGRGRSRGLSGLVVAQIAVAVLLLSGAVLLVRTVAHLEEGRSAFDGSVVTFWVNAPASRYADEAGPAVVQRLLDTIRQVPGVNEAAVNRCTPYGTSCARTLLFQPERSTRASDAPTVERHYVSESYFHALGIPLIRGRLLNDDDRRGRPAVTVVNETAARRFWPGDDPIGKRVWFSSVFTSASASAEVVGIVGDVKYWPIDEPVGPDFYTSYLQFTYPSSLYIVKTADAAAVLPAIRRAVAGFDPSLPLSDVRILEERAADAVARPRFTAAATAIFAIASAGLAAMGVFGMMAYTVSMRREELALRLALGATPQGLRARVIVQAIRLSMAGGAAGLLAGFWLLRSLRSVLYGISPTDPVTLGIAMGAMCTVAVLSALVPAWRASVTDPMLVLRR